MESGKKWVFWERDIFTVIGYINKKMLDASGYYKSINGKKVNAIYAKDDKIAGAYLSF